ncbi:hypothetical protein WEI85_03130 [Actinomycetes bacterium KLBMP 9797]
MSTFLDQLPTLIGVVIGTLGTILATSVSERAKWTRTQSVRWDDRRIDAYATYARTLKEVHLLAMRLTSPTRSSDRDIDVPLLIQAEAECSKAWEGVLLLGDAATVTAGREWRNAAARVVSAAHGRAGDGFDRDAAVQRIDEARDAFYLAARASLAVGGGAVSQASWLLERQRKPL